MKPTTSLLSVLGLAAFACLRLSAVHVPQSTSQPNTAKAGTNQGMIQVQASGSGDFSSKLGRCLAAVPATGGFCDARNLSGPQTMSADILLNKPFTTVLLGPLTLQMGTHHIIVPAGTQSISLIGSSVY